MTLYLPTKDIPQGMEALELIANALDMNYQIDTADDLPTMLSEGLYPGGEWEMPNINQAWIQRGKEDPYEIGDMAEEILMGTEQGWWLQNLIDDPMLMPEQDNLDQPVDDPLMDLNSEVEATLTPLNLGEEEEELLLNPTLEVLLLERLP